MTNAVLSEIERQKRSEQAKAWDKAEAELAAEVAKKIEQRFADSKTKPSLQLHLQAMADMNEMSHAMKLRFVTYCERWGVRNLPAKPQTVSGFLLDNNLSHEQALEALSIIAAMHDRHGLASPAHTTIVRAALELALQGGPDDKPPRSWKKEEQIHWLQLPAEVRYAISRRERDRDKALMRWRDELGKAQTELKELRKQNVCESETEDKATGRPGQPNPLAAG